MLLNAVNWAMVTNDYLLAIAATKFKIQDKPSFQTIFKEIVESRIKDSPKLLEELKVVSSEFKSS